MLHSKNIQFFGSSECDELYGIIIFQVVYVTAVMPYVILLILFIRGLFLEGATRGLFYFANPVMERLGDPEVRMYSIYRMNTHTHRTLVSDLAQNCQGH